MRLNLSLQLVQVVLLIACICVGTSSESGTDGKPGCRTRYEFSRLWRHAEVNDFFWECTNWRQATVRQCPKETFFHEWWQTCVPLQMWEDTPFRDPPSSAYDDEDPCEVIVVEPECPAEPPPSPQPTDPPTTTEDTTTDTELPESTTPETTTTETTQSTTTTSETTAGPEDPPDDTTLETESTDRPTQPTPEHPPTETTTTTEETTTTTEETTTTTTTPEPTTTTTTTTTEPTTTTTKSPFTICPGADETHMIEGNQSCQRPTCNNDLYLSKARLPALDPGQYYTCLTPTVLRVNYCPSATHCFSYALQKCVTPEEWFNPCGNV